MVPARAAPTGVARPGPCSALPRLKPWGFARGVEVGNLSVTWQPFWVRGWPHRARRAPPTAWCDGTSRVGSCGPSRSCARWMRNARVQGGSLTPAYTRSHACVGTEDLSKARTHPTPENCRPVRKALAALLGIHGGPWWQRLLPLRGGQAWAPRIVGFTMRTSLG